MSVDSLFVDRLFGNFGAFSWKIMKRHVVSHSSAEVEYHSMVVHSKHIRLFCDSQSSLHIAKNQTFHDRTKHIEIDCYFVRDDILKDNPFYVICSYRSPVSGHFGDRAWKIKVWVSFVQVGHS